jgi:prevent-host-death family protein
MKFAPITDARMHFTDLIPQVAAGEEIIVTQRGKPVVKLVRVDVSGRRPIGVFTVLDSFDDPIDWAAPQESNR